MLNIPPQAAILDRAIDLRSDAQRQHDAGGARAYAAIIVNVVCHYATLAWDYQYLAVASDSTPGLVYQVSPFGCSCEARKPCYHMRLRELLIGIMETEAETADQEAERMPYPPDVFAKIAAARTVRYASL